MSGFQSLLRRAYEADPDRVRNLIPAELAAAAATLGLPTDTLVLHVPVLYHGVRGTLEAMLAEGVDLVSLLSEHEQSFASAHYELAPQDLTNTVFRRNPRPLAEVFGQSLVDTPPERTVLPTRSAATYPLFAHQRRAVASVIRKLGEPSARILLHMPTGAGKTRSAMNVAAEFLRHRDPSVVLWAASTGELLEQAALEADKAWSALGNREITVGLGWAGRIGEAATVKDGFVVASLQSLWSLYRRDHDAFAALAKRVSLMVFDETHQATADTYQTLVDAIASDSRLLGLSATPGRSATADTPEDFALADMFDGRSVPLDTTREGYPNPVDYLVAQGYLADTTFEIVHVPKAENDGDDGGVVNDGEQIEGDLLPRSDYTLSVLELVRDVITRGHVRVMVFAASVRHAQHVATLLNGLGAPARCVTGETPKPDRQAAISWFKAAHTEPRVITNFGVLTTGFDAPSVTVSIIARPTRSLVLYSQMVGRAIRGPKANGTDEALVVTVVDDEIPGFSDVAEAFINWNTLWKTQGER